MSAKPADMNTSVLTMRETLQLIRTHRPIIVIYENVPSITDVGSNEHDLACLDEVEFVLSETCYANSHLRANPLVLWEPENRDRLWGFGLLDPDHKLGTRLQVVIDIFRSFQCESGHHFAIDHFLLEDDHPHVLKVLRMRRHRMDRSADAACKQLDTKTHKWWHKQRDSQRLAPLAWALGLADLSLRQKDIVQDLADVNGDNFLNLIADVTQSQDRLSVRFDRASPCVTPKAVILLGHRLRFMGGIEAMMLQMALPQEELMRHMPALESLGDRLLFDLAGNAFHLVVFTGLFIAILAAVDEDDLGYMLDSSRRLSSAGPVAA